MNIIITFGKYKGFTGTYIKKVGHNAHEVEIFTVGKYILEERDFKEV